MSKNRQTIQEAIRTAQVDFRLAWVQYEHLIEPDDIRLFTLDELRMAKKVCARYFERQIDSEIFIRERNQSKQS